MNAADPFALAQANFLANIGHEVRTPLAAILGFTELLERALPPEVGRECLDHLRGVKRNGEILLDLVSGVMELSRIESGESIVASAPCPIREWIADVGMAKQAYADARGFAFKVELDESARPIPAVLHTDPDKLRLALSHLIDGALAFSEARAAELQVALTDGEPAPRLRFVLTVAEVPSSPHVDNGSSSAHSFEPAETSKASLGLIIARKLAEQLGGSLDIDLGTQHHNHRSLLTLTVPVMIPPRGLNGGERKGEPLENLSRERVSPANLQARILVAEDHRDNQQVIALRLKHAGAAVTVAPNGREAVNLAIAARDDGKPFDLVLMDMQMPILDGYGATKTLRDEGFDQLPIIALTAHALPEDRAECLRYGCDDYVTKPIPWNALLQIIADQLNREASASPPIERNG